MGVAKDAVIDTAANALDIIFMDAAAQLVQAREMWGDLTLMIGHVNVAGAMTSVGQPNIGHEIEITAAHLDRLGNIPKLLNHIHKAQEIGGAHYAGSVCRMNWGEIEDKGYSVVTFQEAA
jgi:DNA repair exonuclease SbcCD nuclease subunit